MREISISHTSQLGTGPATQTCAPTRNGTSDLSLCGMVLNQLSHAGQSCLDLQNENSKMSESGPLLKRTSPTNLEKALYKLKSTTQLGGRIIIPGNLFVIGFPQAFPSDQTRLIFQMVPLEAYLLLPQCSQGSESVWNCLQRQFRRHRRDLVSVKFHLIFDLNTPVWYVLQACT